MRTLHDRPLVFGTIMLLLQSIHTSGFSSVVRRPPFRARAAVSSPQEKTSSVGPLNAFAVDAALSAVNNFFLAQPYAAAAITCGTKASAADFVAQRRHYTKRDGTKDEIDVVGGQEMEKFEAPRNIAFLLYGSLYQGLSQEFIYNHLYADWFGSGTELSVVAVKVCFDLFVQTTILTLPIAYLTKAAIFRYSVKEGLQRYWEDITTHGLLLKYFALWGPVQCLTFSIIPEQFRVGWIAVVSFFWLIILSTISAKPRKADIADGKGAETFSEKNVALVQFDDLDEDLVEDAIEECALSDGFTCNIDG